MKRTVQLQTAIPGPRSCELLAEWEQHVTSALPRTAPIFVARTEGAVITDVDGNRFIDFAGGIAVLNVGANHPEVVAAVQQQAAAYLHTCVHVTLYEPYLRLARELVRLTPGRFPKRALLVNSGAEAVENAGKIARRATGRPAIIAMSNAFHGRTLLAMSLTGKAHPYRQGFGPLAPEIYRAPFPYPYRMPQYSDPRECAWGCIAELERLMDVEIGAKQVAAVIVEPVQGEGGFIVPPPEYLPRLQAVCRERGVLLILDEIQTGFARTGRMYAAEHWGLEPDLILSAKSLGAGLPIAAVIGRAEVMEAVQTGGVGGTYTGNPVACAAALKVIEIMQRDGYAERAAAIGERVADRFRQFQQRYPLVGEARGLGAMQALELVRDRKSRAPAGDAAALVVQHAYAHGLIVLRTWALCNVIRFLAPLNISDDQLDEGMDILGEALARAQA